VTFSVVFSAIIKPIFDITYNWPCFWYVLWFYGRAKSHVFGNLNQLKKNFSFKFTNTIFFIQITLQLLINFLPGSRPNLYLYTFVNAYLCPVTSFCPVLVSPWVVFYFVVLFYNRIHIVYHERQQSVRSKTS